MRTSSLFSRPRFKLAGAYAGVMGIFLGVIGFALHEAIASSSDHIIERELVTLGSVLEDSLEPLLETPGVLTPLVLQHFPYLCLTSQNCRQSPSEPDNQRLVRSPKSAALLLDGEGYALHLLDLQGNSLATLRGKNQQISPLPIAQISASQTWGNTKNLQGRRYRIYTLQLDTTPSPGSEPWGYLQIGRSHQRLEEYMHWLHLLLLIGLPFSMGGIAIAAWWLSGLAMKPIFDSYRKIEQFSADVAHELRTPLSAMRATAEAELGQLSNTSIHAEASTLHVLHRQILRLSQMVQDLLLLSRLEQQSYITMQPVCLNEILEDLEEEFMPLITESKIEFQLELTPKKPLIFGDSDALYRLFINLISNAIQHTPQGGNVQIRSYISDKTVSVEVHDSGPGIALELQPYIFQRFYRIDRDRSRTTGGTGLGLAIAKAIVQQHGGEIRVISHLGQGSCFQISFQRLRDNVVSTKVLKFKSVT